MAFLLRWMIAFALIAVTFNPTPWNYMRWSRANFDEQLSLVVFLGLLLVVGYIIFLRATFRSIGGFGMFLVAAIFGALVWVLYDWGVMTFENSAFNTWMGIMALSLVLGVGLSWSIFRRMISGQADVDDIDE